MEQKLQNVLIPNNTVAVKIGVDETWRREYGTENLVFGIQYENSFVGLLFEAPTPEKGVFKFVAQTATETVPEVKTLKEISAFEGEHEFEIGKDDDELYIIAKGGPIGLRQAIKDDAAGEPISFISPELKFRRQWNVKIKLL